MKKIVALFFVIALSFSVRSQDFEGIITFAISYPNLNAEMKAMKSALPKEMEFFVKEGKAKMEQSFMGGTMVVLFDGSTSLTETYTDLMGQKIKTIITKEDLEKSIQNIDVDIQIIKDEQKNIAGYRCKKVILKQTGQPDLTLFISEAIKVKSVMALSPRFADLNGFPLEYSVNMNGMAMLLTAKKVEKKFVEDAAFNPPEGEYRKMSAFGSR